MKHSYKKIVSLLIAAIMLFSVLPLSAVGVLAESVYEIPVEEVITSDTVNESSFDSAMRSDERMFGHVHTERTGGRALTEAYLKGELEDTRDPLPAKYDSRDYGYITSVKNQNPYGTCWAHASVAAVEAYMIKHGIINAQTGAPATTSMNLSEYHLAWFNYTSAYDKLGMLTGDKTTPSSSYLNLGGTAYHSTYTFLRGTGPAAESTSALAYSAASSSGLNSQYAYNYNVARVTDVVWIPTSNKDAVKRAIMEYGAGYIAYYHSDSYVNSSTGGYCYKGNQYSNHAVTVVGWDDNYATSNFNSSARPSSPGAWIIKNSWGSSWGRSGYFYLSYEDVPSRNDDCAFYKAVNSDVYTNCYQYDGTTNSTSSRTLGNNASVANIFTAKASETITAVAFAPGDEGTSYTIKVYKNLSSSTNPTSGTLMSTKTGSVDFPGYHTAVLDTPVSISNGETFSVVVTLSVRSGSVHMPYDASGNYSWVTWTHKNNGNTSYYKEASSSSWTDCPSNGDFRIKAFTGVAQASYTVNAQVNNSSYGSVQVSGNTITANPYNGYYLADAYIVSGDGTVNVSGNTITVTPSSNCTVMVEFAPKQLVTINLFACGMPESYINAYSGDTVQLPDGVSFIPDGWNFIGWCETTINDSGEDDDIKSAPNYYKPGSSYVVGNAYSLYALYSMVEGGGTGEIVYELVGGGSDERGEFDGRYVITSGSNSNLTVLKSPGTTVSLESASAGGAIPYASTGMQLDGNVLRNVSDEYVFDIASTGSTYTIINEATGCYIGAYTDTLWSLDSNYSASQWINWNIEYDGAYGCMKLENTVGGESYPYLVLGNNSYFVMSNIHTNNKTYLWRETGAGTISYSTNPYGPIVPDPTPEPTPVPTAVPTAAPTEAPTSVPVAPVAPTGLSASLSNGKALLSWNAVSNATHYDVYRTLKGGTYAYVGTSYTTSYHDTGAPGGSTYYYKVKAVNYVVESPLSTWVSIAVPASSGNVNAPTGITASIVNRKPFISWNASANAVSYQVYRSTKSSSGFKIVGTVYDTSFTDTAQLTGFKKYYYKVRAVNAVGGVSAYSKVVSVTTFGINAPIGVNAYLLDNMPTIEWSASANATNYQIYRSTKLDTGYTLLGTVYDTFFTDCDTLANLTRYYYKIRALDDFGTISAYSDAVSVVSYGVATPINITAGLVDRLPTINWSPSNNAAYYQVYRSTAQSSGYMLVGTVYDTCFVDTDSLIGLTKYYYKVRALDSDGVGSSFSDIVSVVAFALNPPTDVSAVLYQRMPLITWNVAEFASAYEVYRSTKATSDFKLVGIVEETSYVDHAALSGLTKYYYKVRAVDEYDNRSSFSAVVSVVTYGVGKPTGLSARIVETKPYLSWNASQNATRYQVFRSTSKSSGYKRIATVEETYFTDTSALTALKAYYYKIRAIDDSNGTYSEYSAVVKVIAYGVGKTSGVVASVINGHTQLSWNAATNAVGYNVYRSTNSSSGFALAGTVYGTSLVDAATLTEGATYYYKVRAFDSYGNNGDYSAVVSVLIGSDIK